MDATPDMATNAGFYDDLLDFRARNMKMPALRVQTTIVLSLVCITGSQRDRKKIRLQGFRIKVFANARFSFIVKEMCSELRANAQTLIQ